MDISDVVSFFSFLLFKSIVLHSKQAEVDFTRLFELKNRQLGRRIQLNATSSVIITLNPMAKKSVPMLE